MESVILKKSGYKWMGGWIICELRMIGTFLLNCSCNKSDIAQANYSEGQKYEWIFNSEEWNHPRHFEIGLG